MTETYIVPPAPVIHTHNPDIDDPNLIHATGEVRFFDGVLYQHQWSQKDSQFAWYLVKKETLNDR